MRRYVPAVVCAAVLALAVAFSAVMVTSEQDLIDAADKQIAEYQNQIDTYEAASKGAQSDALEDATGVSSSRRSDDTAAVSAMCEELFTWDDSASYLSARSAAKNRYSAEDGGHFLTEVMAEPEMSVGNDGATFYVMDTDGTNMSFSSVSCYPVSQSYLGVTYLADVTVKSSAEVNGKAQSAEGKVALLVEVDAAGNVLSLDGWTMAS